MATKYIAQLYICFEIKIISLLISYTARTATGSTAEMSEEKRNVSSRPGVSCSP